MVGEYYDLRLAPENLWPLGKRLRQELQDSINVILQLRPKRGELLDEQPWIKESIKKLRNPYTDPLNVLQVELLHRSRANPDEVHPQGLTKPPWSPLPVSLPVCEIQASKQYKKAGTPGLLFSINLQEIEMTPAIRF